MFARLTVVLSLAPRCGIPTANTAELSGSAAENSEAAQDRCLVPNSIKSKGLPSAVFYYAKINFCGNICMY